MSWWVETWCWDCCEYEDFGPYKSKEEAEKEAEGLMDPFEVIKVIETRKK